MLKNALFYCVVEVDIQIINYWLIIVFICAGNKEMQRLTISSFFFHQQ